MIKKTKINIALEHLSVFELNSFSKYLSSPYFNQDERLFTIFEIYNDHIRKSSTEILTKQDVWSVIFPDKKYNDVQMRKLNSKLLKALEEFLGQKTYEKDLFLKKNMILKGIRQRKIERLYNSAVSAASREIEQTYDRSSAYLYAKFFNAKERLDLFSENEILRKRSKNVASDVNIQEISDFLDMFYIAEKLRYMVKLQGWKKNFEIDQEIHHTKELGKMLRSGLYDDVIPIKLYRIILRSQQEPDNIENYKLLKQLVEEHIDVFPDDEIREIYDALLSFCVRRVNKGDLSFQEETLDIYKESLKKEVLFRQGYLTAVTFNNIVFFALRTGQYDWAETFINEYGHYLNDKDRNSSVSLSMARVEFYRKNYGKVIELLQQVEMKSVVYNLSAKTLLLSSYYELEEYDALDSFLNSFSVYINREKSISSRKRNLYKKLLSFVNKIININPNDKEAVDKLSQEIEETEGLIIKPWLLAKVKEKRKRGY